VELTTPTEADAATDRSTRKMGAELGVSACTAMRHWQANVRKPHIVGNFKESRDLMFVQYLEDILGL